MHLSLANSVEPDQTLRVAASDLALYCLSMSCFGDMRHKWVNNFLAILLLGPD